MEEKKYSGTVSPISILPPYQLSNGQPQSPRTLHAEPNLYDLLLDAGKSPDLSPQEKATTPNIFRDYQRVRLDCQASHLTDECKVVCKKVRQAIRLREAYEIKLNERWFPLIDLDKPESLDLENFDLSDQKSFHGFRIVNGMAEAWEGEEDDRVKSYQVDKTVDQFYQDLGWIMGLATSGPAKTFCYGRLKILEARFQLHVFLNEINETNSQKSTPHRDFYNVRKIDNHVHHSACMNQKHLLRFMKSRLKKQGHVHCMLDGETKKPLTLQEVFDNIGLTAYDLSLDTLDMHGHRDTFDRFDRFNQKYNPIGASELRTLFLKTDNFMQGKFLADITKQVISDLEEQKYQFAEYRLSIYGKSGGEWDKLASWICRNKLQSTNVRWMIQIPRIYNVYKQKGIIDNFGEMLDNIFKSLFEVTIDPSSHPELHLFLQHVVAFDSVDDESKREVRKDKRYPLPNEWNRTSNPPYSYWSYYIWANLTVLNKLRRRKNYNTFAYRPHAGEAGDVEHLAVTFLLANSINHGIMLSKSQVLQYLYYVAQIGLSVSPLSNNLLFLDYEKNPFPNFFKRGLNVTLSTDDPLMIHYTKDPLLEEYSVAAQVWRLSSSDMCEIARNSVYQSGFEHSKKQKWLGQDYDRHGAASNNIEKTNVPNLRLQFRTELYDEEMAVLAGRQFHFRRNSQNRTPTPPKRAADGGARKLWPQDEPAIERVIPVADRNHVLRERLAYLLQKDKSTVSTSREPEISRDVEKMRLALFGVALFMAGFFLAKKTSKE